MVNMQTLLEQFRKFKESFHGDPEQYIQQMLDSGRVTQGQYNQAVRLADELYSHMQKSQK